VTFVKPGPKNRAPAFHDENATFLTPENNALASFRATATDPDGDVLVYSISGGADGAKFAINGSTGVLVFRAPPDFEKPTDANADNAYLVEVTVSDGNLTDLQRITVQVTDVLEAPPNVAPVIRQGEGPLLVAMSEDGLPIGWSLPRLEAFDADGGSMTWSLGANSSNGTTSVSGTGVSPKVSYVPVANFHGVDEFVVKVTDETSLSDSIVIRVTVSPVNDAPVITSSPQVAVKENQTHAIEVNASDPEGDTLLFALSGGADQAFFSINAASGLLAFSSPPDFEKPVDADADNVYEVLVTASDGDLSVTQGVSVEVMDVEDTLILSLEPSEVLAGIPSDAVVGQFKLNGRSVKELGASVFLKPNPLVRDDGMSKFWIDLEGRLRTSEALEVGTIDLSVVLGKDSEPETISVTVIPNEVKGEGYEESALMIRETGVVDNPLRTGLNPIEKVEERTDGVYVATKFPHGRKEGDSVVLDGVQGLKVNETRNWNFLVDKVRDDDGIHEFRLRLFGKDHRGNYTGEFGKPVTVSGQYRKSPEDFLLGVWTFGHLIGNMVGELDDPRDFLSHWSSQWKFRQTINLRTTDVRRSPTELPAWPKVDGKPSLAKAPFRLMAIANRLDLWKEKLTEDGIRNAGEGRFVFCLTNGYDETGDSYVQNMASPVDFTLIFEYGQKARDRLTFASWVRDWHALSGIRGKKSVPPREYLERLEAVGHRFSKRGADPGKPNGNSINQVRTNEIVLGGPWQLREFTLVSRKTALTPLPGKMKIKAVPDLRSKDQVGLWMTTTKGNPVFPQNSDEKRLLALWLNAHEGDILNSEVSEPAPPVLVGGTAEEPSHSSHFNPPGVKNLEVRHKFSLSTCTGCHTGETGTNFTMVKPRSFGSVSGLAKFLTGGKHKDPVTRVPRHFDDLAAREKIMMKLRGSTKGFLPESIIVANSTISDQERISIVGGDDRLSANFSLVAGPGARDNHRFRILGQDLKLRTSEREVGPVTIRICTDFTGLPNAEVATIEKPVSLWVGKQSKAGSKASVNLLGLSMANAINLHQAAGRADKTFNPRPNRVH